MLGQKYHREEIGHSPACHGAYGLGGEKDVSQKQTLNMHFLRLMIVSAKDGSPGKDLTFSSMRTGLAKEVKLKRVS